MEETKQNTIEYIIDNPDIFDNVVNSHETLIALEKQINLLSRHIHTQQLLMWHVIASACNLSLEKRQYEYSVDYKNKQIRAVDVGPCSQSYTHLAREQFGQLSERLQYLKNKADKEKGG